eukprot:11204882-Lingulodinium_polyedra.AAC.1
MDGRRRPRQAEEGIGQRQANASLARMLEETPERPDAEEGRSSVAEQHAELEEGISTRQRCWQHSQSHTCCSKQQAM